MTNGSARIELDDGAPVELLGRHVLVTGASRGIGAAIAREMARGGARVALVSRRLEHAEAARAALPHPERHAAFAADVTIERAAGELVARVEAAGGPLFALVNNVGRGEAVGFVEAGESHWREMIDANLMSAVFCTRAALGGMRARHEGRIVNVASTASLRGYRYVSAYTAAKHALLGLTRSLALEVGKDGITVNAVCPGYTDTEMLARSARAASARTGQSEAEMRARFAADNQGGRLVQPGEVARVVAWFCGSRAAAITGKHVVVDGRQLEIGA